jgi:hypothetical protein
LLTTGQSHVDLHVGATQSRSSTLSVMSPLCHIPESSLLHDLIDPSLAPWSSWTALRSWQPLAGSLCSRTVDSQIDGETSRTEAGGGCGSRVLKGIGLAQNSALYKSCDLTFSEEENDVQKQLTEDRSPESLFLSWLLSLSPSSL